MVKKGKPARTQMPLRIPQALRTRLERSANRAGISMNAEIGFRLSQAYDMETRFGGPLATALVERMGQAMAAVGECGGMYASGKTGHRREWLHFVTPYDRAAAAAVAILKINRPTVDGAVPARSAVEDIERSGVEAVEQIAAEVEQQAQRAADDGPAPSMEPPAMWDRARRRVAVEYGRTPAGGASTPEELREKIQRAYADLGALLAALETPDPAEKK